MRYNNSFTNLKLIPSKLSKHIYFHRSFNCLGTFFISLIIYRYKKTETFSNETIQDNLRPKKIYISLFIILIILLFQDLLIYFYIYTLKDLDFWMLELLIITYFSKKILQKSYYKHQVFAIGINLIPCVLKIITIYISSINNDKNANPILYIKYKWIIPIGIIVYLLLLAIESYGYTKLKWFIDKKYLDPNLILTIYGGIGTIFYLIVSFISTFSKCSSHLKNYICQIKKGDDYYIENISLYFHNFKSEIFTEILIIILGIIFVFFYNFLLISIIKLLSPIHIIFSFPLYYFLQKIIFPITTLIKEGTFFSKTHIENIDLKYTLDLSGDIISSISFIIYLEIIELNCFNFTYNLRRNIISRSQSELKIMKEDADKKFVYLDNGDVEEFSYDSIHLDNNSNKAEFRNFE